MLTTTSHSPFHLLLTALTCALLCSSPQASASEPFQDARKYTVKVRTSIATPFKEDSLGTLSGTAFLVDAKRGWLLTNAHVSGRSPAKISVAWDGADELDARLVYADRLIDLAIIAIDPSLVPSTAEDAPLACDSRPEVGLAVGAYGHPRGEYFRGARGIISGLTANLSGFTGEFLHIDTPINPGNSGGPIIDLKSGAVVGVATAAKNNAQGMNYAIQIHQACKILKLLQAEIDPSAPNLNVTWIRSSEEPKDLRVARVFAGQKLPLKDGDQIVRVIGGEFSHLRSWSQLAHDLRGRGQTTEIVINRAHKELTIEIPINRDSLVTERVGFSFSGLIFARSENALFEEFNSRQGQVVITHVASGSIADAAEFEAGDWIVSLNGRAVTTLEDFQSRIAAASGSAVEIQIRRLDFYQGRIFGDFVKHVVVTDPHLITFPKSKKTRALAQDAARHSR